MHGCQSQLGTILTNENLKFDSSEVQDLPSFYEDAKAMIDEKLQKEMQLNLPKLTKLHSAMKL